MSNPPDDMETLKAKFDRAWAAGDRLAACRAQAELLYPREVLGRPLTEEEEAAVPRIVEKLQGHFGGANIDWEPAARDVIRLYGTDPAIWRTLDILGGALINIADMHRTPPRLLPGDDPDPRGWW